MQAAAAQGSQHAVDAWNGRPAGFARRIQPTQGLPQILLADLRDSLIGQYLPQDLACRALPMILTALPKVGLKRSVDRIVERRRHKRVAGLLQPGDHLRTAPGQNVGPVAAETDQGRAEVEDHAADGRHPLNTHVWGRTRSAAAGPSGSAAS